MYRQYENPYTLEKQLEVTMENKNIVAFIAFIKR